MIGLVLDLSVDTGVQAYIKHLRVRVKVKVSVWVGLRLGFGLGFTYTCIYVDQDPA